MKPFMVQPSTNSTTGPYEKNINSQAAAKNPAFESFLRTNQITAIKMTTPETTISIVAAAVVNRTSSVFWR